MSAKFSALDVWGKFFIVLSIASQYRELRYRERLQFNELAKNIEPYARATNAVQRIIGDTIVSRSVHYVGGPLGDGAPFLEPAAALKLEQDILNYNMRVISKAYAPAGASCSFTLY